MSLDRALALRSTTALSGTNLFVRAWKRVRRAPGPSQSNLAPKVAAPTATSAYITGVSGLYRDIITALTLAPRRSRALSARAVQDSRVPSAMARRCIGVSDTCFLCSCDVQASGTCRAGGAAATLTHRVIGVACAL